MSFACNNERKKKSKEDKRHRKRLKPIRKVDIDKNKWVFYVNLIHFTHAFTHAYILSILCIQESHV